MESVKKYLNVMMSDHTGCASSKRMIVFLCAILIAVAFVANLFWKFTVEQFMFDGIMYIILGGMSITGVEKFSSKVTKPTVDESTIN